MFESNPEYARLESAVRAAQSADEVAELQSVPGNGGIGVKGAATALARACQHWDAALIRNVHLGGMKPSLEMFANPHFKKAHIAFALSDVARRKSATWLIQAIAIAARRCRLNIPPWTLETLYHVTQPPSEHGSNRGYDESICLSVLDVIASGHMGDASPEHSADRVMDLLDRKGYLRSDEVFRPVVEHPLADAQEAIRVYRLRPSLAEAAELVRSRHVEAPEVRKIAFEQADESPELVRWLLFNPQAADFARAWDFLWTRDAAYLQSFVLQEHFPLHALAWLPKERLAVLLASDNSELRMKVMLAVHSGDAPLPSVHRDEVVATRSGVVR